jgi:hypothetical protein
MWVNQSIFHTHRSDVEWYFNESDRIWIRSKTKSTPNLLLMPFLTCRRKVLGRKSKRNMLLRFGETAPWIRSEHFGPWTQRFNSKTEQNTK